MTPRRWTWIVVSFAAAFGLSGFVAWREWQHTGTFPALPWRAHVAAFAVFVLETISRGTKVQWGARALGIPLRWSTAVRVSLGGDFGASVTPGRVGAEPARFLVLAEAGVGTAPAMLILFFELALELVSLVVVCGALAALSTGGVAAGGMIAVVGGYALFVIGLAVGAFTLASRPTHGPPPPWLRRLGIHAGRWRSIRRALRHLRNSGHALRHARLGPALFAFGLSLCHVALRIGVLAALVYGAGASAPLLPIIVWPLLLLYGGSIAPAPGGGGAVEFGFALGLRNVLSPSMLAATLIWFRVYSFYLYLLAGAVVAGTTVMRAITSDRRTPT